MTLVCDDFGVDIEASGELNPQELIAAFQNAIQDKSSSTWRLGDLYNAGSQFEEFAEAFDPTSLSLKTAQNYGSLCTAWPKRTRVVPVSPSHYDACTALARADVNAALRLLESAFTGGLDRDWVRDEARKLMGDTVERCELLLVYAGDGMFTASGVPSWLAEGYTITKTVKKP